MYRNIQFSTGEYYHLYNRGTDKRKIFLTPTDYSRFVHLLYLCNSTKGIVFRDIPKNKIFDFNRGESLVDIGVYCLMPNHFHLLVREKENLGISLFMKKLLTAYSMYFNLRYERRGALFESRFQAQHADDDQYLKYLFAYIHLNPIKLIQSDWKERGIKSKNLAEKYLSNYHHSSYHEYFSNIERSEGKIINRSSFPDYFESIKDFSDLIKEYLVSTQSNTEDRPMY